MHWPFSITSAISDASHFSSLLLGGSGHGPPYSFSDSLETANMEVASRKKFIEDDYEAKHFPEPDANVSHFSRFNLDSELEKIDSSVADLVEKIVKLMQKRRHLEKLSKSSSLPPADLPLELWEEIFMHCLPEEPYARPVSHEAPLLLTQVCRGWRNVAVSSARLWSSLAIKTSARHERKKDEERFGNMTQLWLERSAAFVQNPSSRLVPVWEALIPHIDHWKEMELKVPEPSLLKLFTSPSCHLPLLEVLKLDVFPEMSSWQTTTFTLQHAPRLKVVSFAHITFDIRVLNINYAQLTDLTLLPQAWAKSEVFLTLDECLDILEVAPNLTRCMLCVEDVGSTRTEPLSSPVREFHISFRDSDRRSNFRGNQPQRQTRLGQFFELIKMPSLQVLTIGNFIGNFADSGTWPNESFLTFLTQSACPLRSVRLAFLPILENELIALLRLTPELTHLVIEARPGVGAQLSVGDDLLRALAVCAEPDCKSCIVPLLESIDFRFCGKRCTERAIIDMIESRQAPENDQLLPRHGSPVKQLKTFGIQMPRRPGDDLSSRLGNWSSRGLEVEIDAPL